MRVVAGTARGRRLAGPKNEDIRPTTDKVREATFNALNSLGVLDNASVADLYAGTGACGIEALSRGAVSATFVDNNRYAIDVIRANLESTGFGGDVIASDVMRFLANNRTFDLAFVDPPYAFDGWAELLAQLDAAVVVCESNREIPPADGFRSVRSRRYGATHVTILERQT